MRTVPQAQQYGMGQRANAAPTALPPGMRRREKGK
jgi:hypothetical protein